MDLSWLYFAMIFPLLFGMILRAGYQWTKRHSFVSGVNFSDTDDGIVVVKEPKDKIQGKLFSRKEEVHDDYLGQYLTKKLDDALRSFSTQPIIWVEPTLNKISDIKSADDPEMELEEHIVLSDFTDEEQREDF